MLLKNIIICVFVLLAMIFTIFIVKLYKSGENDWVKTAHANSVVVDIYQGYKGKPNYQIMKLADSRRFTIPKQMMGILKIGDSVNKVADCNFYLFTLKVSKQKIKTTYQ